MAVPVLLTGAGDTAENLYSTNTQNFVGPKPTNTAVGDVLFAQVYTRQGSADFTTPSGWTPVPATVASQTVGVLRCYILAVTSGNIAGLPASWTWTTANTANRGMARVSRITGADQAATLDSSGAYTTAFASSLVLPTMTTISADVLLMAAVVLNTISGSVRTSVAPGTMTKKYGIVSGANPPATELSLHTESRPTAGATGTRTITYSATGIESGAGYLLGIKGAAASNIAPTANAGADQINVEPGATVTLNGSGSTDSDGTIASYAWTQTAGSPSVTLSGSGASRTFTAPLTLVGTTLTFGLTVTDNGGATSTQDTMTVTILPASERVMLAGSWVPAQLRVL